MELILALFGPAVLIIVVVILVRAQEPPSSWNDRPSGEGPMKRLIQDALGIGFGVAGFALWRVGLRRIFRFIAEKF